MARRAREAQLSGERESANEVAAKARERTRDASSVAAVARTAAASDEAFRAVARLLAASIERRGALRLEGRALTVGRVRREVARRFASVGASQPEGNLIASGPCAAEPHHGGDDSQEIQADDAIVVDLFPKAERFSDCTRTFCVRPAEQLIEAHALVKEVQAQVVARLRSELARERGSVGVAAFQLHQFACELFAEQGWSTQLADPDSSLGYVHGLGHGVGEDLHALPSFARDFAGGPQGTIQLWDVITIEPGLYQPGHWGVRIEDLFAIEPQDGSAVARRLTRLPRELDPKRFVAAAAALGA